MWTNFETQRSFQELGPPLHVTLFTQKFKYGSKYKHSVHSAT